MKTFAEFRKDKDAALMATTFNRMKRKGNNLPYFALMKLFLDDTKSMEEIARADGVSVNRMRELHRAFFAPIIDPEKERGRVSYLSARRKALEPQQKSYLNGSAHAVE
jgi:hypothetical protein